MLATSRLNGGTRGTRGAGGGYLVQAADAFGTRDAEDTVNHVPVQVWPTREALKLEPFAHHVERMARRLGMVTPAVRRDATSTTHNHSAKSRQPRRARHQIRTNEPRVSASDQE